MQTQEKHSQAAVLGLQHLLAMYSGSILVPIMIATALGYSTEQFDLPDFHRYLHVWSGNLPPTPTQQIFWYWTPSRSRSSLPIRCSLDYDWAKPWKWRYVWCPYRIRDLRSSCFRHLLKSSQSLPIYRNRICITTIGFNLDSCRYWKLWEITFQSQSGQSLLLAAITCFDYPLINIFTKGFIKSISILIGLVVGTAIAASMGLVDFSPVAAAPLVHVPTPLYFGMPTFEISSIVMMCIIATVSMVESTGVYLALSDITKDPIDSTRLRNGYRAEGLAVLLGGIFNTFPYTGFSQNVGLVKLSGIKTRLPIYYAAGFLVLLGLLPKFGALAQIIPSPVLGGAMLVMFGFVSIQGMQILARVDFANNEHNFLIAAVSIAAGVGLNNSNLFVSMPTAFQMFFSNGIVVASLLAIVLNAVLIIKRNKKKRCEPLFMLYPYLSVF